MKNILILRSSINGNNSYTNKTIDILKEKLQNQSEDIHFTERDLVKQPIPVLVPETFHAIREESQQTTAETESFSLADILIKEIKSVDAIIIGIPRYNFHAPAQFISYIDYIARPRVTFQYTENGPIGLLPDIPVYAIIGSGGYYSENQSTDVLVQWLKQVLGFVGLNTIHLIHVEGIGVDVDSALPNAITQIEKLI